MKPLDNQIQVKALTYAYKLLSYRPRSQQELSQRLEKKGFPPEVVKDIIEYLKEKGYLNDEAFAWFWINSRLSAKPTGARRLRVELIKKGIENSIIEQVLSQFKEHYNETDLAHEAGLRRLNVLQKDERLNKEKIRNRLSGYLARRGFSYEIVREVLDRILR